VCTQCVTMIIETNLGGVMTKTELKLLSDLDSGKVFTSTQKGCLREYRAARKLVKKGLAKIVLDSEFVVEKCRGLFGDNSYGVTCHYYKRLVIEKV